LLMAAAGGSSVCNCIGRKTPICASNHALCTFHYEERCYN